jgi:hypothetical protein
MARTKTKTEQISAYVESATKKKVEALAKTERRSVSEILDMIIEKFL